MSACLEVAGGAFAVVGAADVLIRLGREVYSFFCDVADAPDNLRRLRDTIQEVTLLVETAQQCLKALVECKQFASVASLDHAMKGLNRELKSLNMMSVKFRGKGRTWGKIKYVLDEKRVSRTLVNLERSKTMLGDALIVACRHLSALDHESTRDLVYRCHEQLGIKTDKLIRTLTSTSADLEKKVTDEHQKTRDIIAQVFDDILTAKLEGLNMGAIGRKQKSNRDVYFFGERRDMIMAYLLLAKAQFETAIKQLTAADEAASLRQIEWLRSEFEHLVASAAQEEAARHAGTTSTSFDQWYYNDSSKDVESEDEHSLVLSSAHAKSNKTGMELYSERLSHRPMQAVHTYAQKTALGTLSVRVPRVAPRNTRPSQDQEAGFTFTCNIGKSLNVINASFRREGLTPRICAQLNVYTLVQSEEPYNTLFSRASIGEIDAALRNGTISPYHINGEGRNMCLYYAAEHTRTDLFHYLDDQGIGVANINHDFSVVAGLFRRSMANHDRPKLEDSLDTVLDKVQDTSTFLFETTMNMLIWDYYQRRPRSLLKNHIQRLRKEGMLQASQLLSIIGNPALDDKPWDWPTVQSLIFALIANGVQVDNLGSNGRNRLQRCFVVLQLEHNPGDPEAVVNAANALIQAGIDIHHRDHQGQTPSMYARRYGHWEEWCTALEMNCNKIEDVLRVEEAEWLLRDDWKTAWEEHFGPM